MTILTSINIWILQYYSITVLQYYFMLQYGFTLYPWFKIIWHAMLDIFLEFFNAIFLNGG